MLAALSQVYAVIQFIMKMIGIWEGFLDWQEEQNIAIRHEKQIAREQAIQAGINAETDEDIWKAQEDVVKNRPTP
jgi:hypothetical protein